GQDDRRGARGAGAHVRGALHRARGAAGGAAGRPAAEDGRRSGPRFRQGLCFGQRRHPPAAGRAPRRAGPAGHGRAVAEALHRGDPGARRRRARRRHHRRRAGGRRGGRRLRARPRRAPRARCADGVRTGDVMIDALERFVSGVTARDVLTALADILIVYYAIYRVLLLIKGTRAAQMVIGLVLIGAGFFAAHQLELATVSWLLDNFINYFIIIIIVVFQHDIRRGLVRIGQNLFSFGRTYEETHVFEEVIHACEKLARARIGAIIVIEREGDVAEFVDTGKIVDARVSQELLVSLFVPSRDNVLHDGAAVVKNLRVQQAGALLPLSRNPKLDAELGTRHRAAIGITEETDAVAVVVSEERGEISLCFHGNMARDLDADTLRKALMGLF